MMLNIIVDDYSMNLNIPEGYVEQAAESLDRIDAEMARGIQLGRDWVEAPGREQRCQLAANKLLTALETDNEQLAMLSAGYILRELPQTRRVRIDTSGEMQGSRFES